MTGVVGCNTCSIGNTAIETQKPPQVQNENWLGTKAVMTKETVSECQQLCIYTRLIHIRGFCVGDGEACMADVGGAEKPGCTIRVGFPGGANPGVQSGFPGGPVRATGGLVRATEGL